jgi:uncharacterized protein (UPF0254 family)
MNLSVTCSRGVHENELSTLARETTAIVFRGGVLFQRSSTRGHIHRCDVAATGIYRRAKRQIISRCNNGICRVVFFFGAHLSNPLVKLMGA